LSHQGKYKVRTGRISAEIQGRRPRGSLLRHSWGIGEVKKAAALASFVGLDRQLIDLCSAQPFSDARRSLN